MRYCFKNKKIEALFTEEKDARKYPKAVVDAFFDVMLIIIAAEDERDLRAMKSLHFEKLKGERGNKGERSIRLNDQWRLIVNLRKDEEGKLILIIDLEDYH